jgi:pilus assembly protein Flp/PilA
VRLIRKLARDDRGTTMIEYGLILALVFLAIVVSVHSVADSIIGTWNKVNSQVGNATA